MSAAEPGAATRIRAKLQATTSVVPELPISGPDRATLDAGLRALVRANTNRLCGEDASDEDRLLAGITLVEAIGQLAQELGQGLFRLARAEGVSEQRIGDACGVTQQAVNRRLQRGL